MTPSTIVQAQNAATRILNAGSAYLKGAYNLSVRKRVKVMRDKPYASRENGPQLPFEELCRNHKPAALRIYRRKVNTVLSQSADVHAMREIMSEFGLKDS